MPGTNLLFDHQLVLCLKNESLKLGGSVELMMYISLLEGLLQSLFCLLIINRKT